MRNLQGQCAVNATLLHYCFVHLSNAVETVEYISVYVPVVSQQQSQSPYRVLLDSSTFTQQKQNTSRRIEYISLQHRWAKKSPNRAYEPLLPIGPTKDPIGGYSIVYRDYGPLLPIGTQARFLSHRYTGLPEYIDTLEQPSHQM